MLSNATPEDQTQTSKAQSAPRPQRPPATQSLPSQSPPITKLNIVEKPTLFIDQDLLFLDGQKLGKHISIVVALIHPKTNNETRLELSDLKLEEGLQYSLLSNNKLLLKAKQQT